jgi:hypothetical protein
MPWKSEAQRRWGHTAAGQRALGTQGIKEWDRASKGKKRPQRAKNREK